VRDLISFLGFNNSVNDYYGFVLDQVVSFIPEQKVAMFIPGAKHQLFNLMKIMVKESLVLLLVVSGEQPAPCFYGISVEATVHGKKFVNFSPLLRTIKRIVNFPKLPFYFLLSPCTECLAMGVG
jgi:hypothetical protein